MKGGSSINWGRQEYRQMWWQSNRQQSAKYDISIYTVRLKGCLTQDDSQDHITFCDGTDSCRTQKVEHISMPASWQHVFQLSVLCRKFRNKVQWSHYNDHNHCNYNYTVQYSLYSLWENVTSSNFTLWVQHLQTYPLYILLPLNATCKLIPQLQKSLSSSCDWNIPINYKCQ